MSINICGKKEYRIDMIRGGQGQKSAYTFMNISSIPKKEGKFPERAKINIWGADISNEFSVGQMIRIFGATDLGIDRFDGSTGKTYTNPLIICDADDIQLSNSQPQPKAENPQHNPYSNNINNAEFAEIDDTEEILPF